MEFQNYTRYLIEANSAELDEIIIAELAEFPFESFTSEEEKIAAYIPTNEDSKVIETFVKELVYIKSYSKNIIIGENWNAAWENQFEPIEIDNRCRIRATFHDSNPNFEYEILIQPQMSFGTGHHATTYLMMNSILNHDVKDKRVLDMGCGTGILGILASKRSAESIVGVDNDPVCVENTKENLSLNNVKNFDALLLTDFSIQREFDMILANIQRNVIIEQLPMYQSLLKENGTLFVSGIYENMIEEIRKIAEMNGFIFVESNVKDEWAMIIFRN